MSSPTTGAGAADRSRPARSGARGFWRAARRRSPLLFYTRTSQHWAAFDTKSPHPPFALPDGWSVRTGTRADLPVLKDLGIHFADAARLLDAGHRWFLLCERDRPMVSGWVFATTMPTESVPSGWVTLPPDMVNAEDIFIRREARGRGLAGLAIAALLDRLAHESGARWVITFTHSENARVRAAAAKAGLREFAVVETRKYGLVRRSRNWRERWPDGRAVRTWARVDRYDGPDASPHAAELAERLRAMISHPS